MAILVRKSWHSVALAALALVLCACEHPVDQALAMRVETDVAVPMRDGTMLRADVYLPAGDGPFPVLVYRTPYGKHNAAETYTTHRHAVERGYAVVLQDVRGRYASDGIFEPYRQEGKDGYDTIEWAARQPWSNGEVGTFGLSYPGAVQWLAALEKPPGLKAMAPAMTFSSPRNFFYMNGVFDLSWLPWIYTNIAPDSRKRLGLPGITSDAKAEAEWNSVATEYLDYQPLADLPWLRDEAPYYFEWLAHPPEDAWWDWAEIRGRYADVDAAVLNLSGWYDEAYGPEGAITNFTGLQATRDQQDGTQLILGPWVHGVLSTERHVVGDLDFGPSAAIDYDEVVLRFFDQYLRGIDTGLNSAAPVRYFLTGTNEWRTATSWPPAEASIQALCLAQEKLTLCEDSSPASSGQFEADPKNPVRDPYESFGPHDYSGLAERDDVLTFDSAVLDKDIVVAGNMVTRIFASCDCRDFDLWVRIQDVYPDGRAINLRSPGAEVLRASYRDPAAGRQLLEPGQTYELRLAPIMFANTFLKGHRIRVQISGSFAPHLSRNLQTGESEVVSAESRPVRITIHQGGNAASSIALPVLETPASAGRPLRSVPLEPEPAVEQNDGILASAATDSVEPNYLDAFLSRHAVERYRLVTVDENALRAYIRERSGRENLNLTLFGDVPVSIIPRDAREFFDGRVIGYAQLLGTVAGDETSSVSMLVRPDGSLKAFITTASGNFQIESSGQLPYHIVWSPSHHLADVD